MVKKLGHRYLGFRLIYKIQSMIMRCAESYHFRQNITYTGNGFCPDCKRIITITTDLHKITKRTHLYLVCLSNLLR